MNRGSLKDDGWILVVYSTVRRVQSSVTVRFSQCPQVHTQTNFGAFISIDKLMFIFIFLFIWLDAYNRYQLQNNSTWHIYCKKYRQGMSLQVTSTQCVWHPYRWTHLCHWTHSDLPVSSYHSPGVYITVSGDLSQAISVGWGHLPSQCRCSQGAWQPLLAGFQLILTGSFLMVSQTLPCCWSHLWRPSDR